MEKTPVVVLFDGVCNLCNSSVNFLIDHDPHKHLRFAALQSEAGQELLKGHQLPTQNFDSIVVVENGKVYTKSTAALRIARQLPTPWSWASVFLILPAFVRDPVYSLIARNRYRWFGKQAMCRMPTPELRSRFL